MLKNIRSSHKNRRHRAAFWLMLPGIIVTAIITQIPFLGTIYYSLFSWDVMRPDLGLQFTGLGNFIQTLQSADFYQALLNTVELTGAALIICITCGTILALLLNRSFRGNGLVRTLMISPFFIMPSVTGILWKDMIFNPTFGLEGWFFQSLGMQPADLVAVHPLAFIILVVSWEWTPFFMLVLLAGLQSFPEEIVESSMLDGAGALKRFVYLIIPHLMRYIEVAVFLGLVFILQTFGEIYVGTQGGPGSASTNLSFLVYRRQVEYYQYGSASALSVIIVILTVVVLTVFFRKLRKSFGETLA